MSQNIGNLDRVLRIVIGIALLFLLVVLPGNEKWFGLIGLVPLGTALVGWCPLYRVFGIQTCAVGGAK